MAVPMQQIVPGAVFRFKNGLRRVTRIHEPLGPGCMVDWEYADGEPHRRQSGSLWNHTFRIQAIEQVPDPDLDPGRQTRQLLSAGRCVPCLEQPVAITLTTRCPAKWVMLDMESGELWRHDGQQFHRLAANEVADVVQVARMAAHAPGG